MGSFGDRRLARNVNDLLRGMVEKRTVCLRRLGRSRADEVRFGRTLRNDRVAVSEMLVHAAEPLAAAARQRHVLAVQDTTDLNFQRHAGRSHGLGPVGNGRDLGLLVHPTVAVAAEDGTCLGLCGAELWTRRPAKVTSRRQRPLEAKESRRWLLGAQAAQDTLLTAAHVTVIGDAESDSYDLLARVPDDHTDVLVRARGDRRLATGGKLYAHLNALPVMARFTLDLPSGSTRGRRRPPRRVALELRFGPVTLRRPATATPPVPEHVTLWAVDLRECGALAGTAPLHWRLLTSHEVGTVAQARQIATWYSFRWTVEEVFRLLKRQGVDVEASQVEEAAALQRLAVLALVAAVRALQLVHARQGTTGRAATEVFTADECVVLRALQAKLEGATAKQKTTHAPGSLAWAAWILARLGGWKGYPSEAPPGPLTMIRGLQQFHTIVQGVKLAQFCA